jgi:hypothetical protein
MITIGVSVQRIASFLDEEAVSPIANFFDTTLRLKANNALL